MNLEQWFAIWLACGVLCCLLAFAKKRNPFTWFAIGTFTGLLGLVLVLVLPNGKLHQ